MWVESFSSLSGSSTVDCFPVFPRAFSLGVVMGFDFAGLVVWCFWLCRARLHPVVPLHLLASSPSAVCAMRVGVLPCSLTRCGTSWLGPSGLAIFASIPLVSRPWTVLSWSPLRSLSDMGDRLMVVPRQLFGLGECSPASPNCPTSHVRKHRSFGFSASLSRRVFTMRSLFRVGSVSPRSA